MSFFTALTYYRHCEPSLVTADDLAKFISKLAQLELLDRDYTGPGYQNLTVKFGDSIDQNQNRSVIARELESGVFDHEEINWDLDFHNPQSLEDIIELLTGDTRRVYRAEASLGVPTTAVVAPITRSGSPENEIDFRPDSLVLEIGPLEIGSLDCVPEFAGWIGVSLAGPGYLFPWTVEEVKDRLASSPEIQRIAEVCRTCFPIPQKAISSSMLSKLWAMLPYTSLSKPRGWYWGVHES